MIGINFGCQKTTICNGVLKNEILNKKKFNNKDFEINLLMNSQGDRCISSIIQFKETNRLYSENTKLGIKRYYLSSFHDLPRFIGFIYDLEINNKEIKYFNTDENYDKKNHIFFFTQNKKKIELKAEFIVNSFLSHLKQFIILDSKIEVNHFIISIPDYYSLYQKESLKLILKSIGIEKNYVTLINESTALTLQYGYTNYYEFFNENENEKYVIFIDAGHSKTSFILSKFTKNYFEVIDVDNIIFFGGRDFNYKIYKRCLEIIKKDNNEEIEETGKMKLKLMEVIEKERKNLTVNNEVTIHVDSVYNDYDLFYLLKKEEFEKLIEDDVNYFKDRFQKFYNKFKYKDKLYKIEMAGQLMRTPILQKVINDIIDIKISKTIIIDEIHCIGSSLFGNFFVNNLQYGNLSMIKSYNMYTIYYSIENSVKYPFIKKGDFIPSKDKIMLGNIINNDNKPILQIDFSYDEDEMKEIGLKDLNICSYIININNIINIYGIKKEFKFFLECEIFIDNSFNAKLYCKDTNEYLNNYIKREEKGFFLTEKQKDEYLTTFTSLESDFGLLDFNFDSYTKKKNNLETRLYAIKYKVKNNKELYKKCINLEKSFNRTNVNISNIEQEINSIENEYNSTLIN